LLKGRLCQMARTRTSLQSPLGLQLMSACGTTLTFRGRELSSTRLSHSDAVVAGAAFFDL